MVQPGTAKAVSALPVPAMTPMHALPRGSCGGGLRLEDVELVGPSLPVQRPSMPDPELPEGYAVEGRLGPLVSEQVIHNP